MRIATADDENARAACFAVRRAVFIVEQNIPEAEEWDANDASCTHFLAEDDSGPLGCARLIAQGDTAKIGRVAGLGRAIMLHVMASARAAGFTHALLEAQLYVIPFYEGLGFVAEGPEYDDGSGILHRVMRRQL
jgi:predicted GNAT family N-acyltransferase